MRFYFGRVEDKPYWGTSETEARRACGPKITPVDIDTSKPGILRFLKENGVVPWIRQQPAVAEPPPPASEAAAAAPVPAPKVDDGADALVDWLFDHASYSHIHDVMNAIACRFAETVKQHRANA